MPNVRRIPATRERYTSTPLAGTRKRKVAGYARVSTDREDQQTSYETQLDYYERMIKNHEDWDFAGMYSDEGISGTSTAHREGFQNMIEDALAGNIDLIVTKSVSRFARNTVDSLTTIRELKEHGVEVYFEKENIYTFDGKGEILLTIMSSLAQEESRSISQNVTWGVRKRFASGQASVAFSQFLGYDRDENGGWIVNEEQAEVVRKIYRLFLEGYTYAAIANKLTEEGIPTPAGKKKWIPGTVQSILTNEKYKGDVLFQKEYTVDFLTKKMKKNEGEVEQYYCTDHHPAIIDRETFDLVQAEVERRKHKKGRNTGSSVFSSRIFCSECGGCFVPKTWHSNDPYRKVVWQCQNKYKTKGGDHCRTPHLSEEQIKEKFVKAMNRYIDNKEEILSDMEMAKQVVSDTTDLEGQHAELEERLELLSEQIDRAVSENARKAQDQTEYRKKYDAMIQQYTNLENELAEVEGQIKGKQTRTLTLERLIRETKKLGDTVTDFDDGMWGVFVEKAAVARDGAMTFTMRDGTEITA